MSNLRRDNDLLRVAKQNLEQLAKYKDKHLMDVTDPREDYMDWSQMDTDEDYIRKNSNLST